MSKLERLLNLLAALLHTPVPLTADQIRERLDGYSDTNANFRRSFERDKDDLRSMGIPIRVEAVPGSDPPVDGYRIVPSEYGGSDPQLEPDELAALHLATGLVRVDGVSGDQALVRVGGVLGEAKADLVAALPADPNLGPLFEAISTGRSVTFDYNNAGRLLDPFKLSFSRGRWYLTGYDHARDDERQFRVDRIEGSVAHGGPVTTQRRSSTLDRTEPWGIGDEEPTTARLLIDADQAAWATHYIGSDAIVESRDDGSVEFELTIRNREAFRSFVLTFLDHAELLSPAELRSDIVEWLDGLAV